MVAVGLRGRNDRLAVLGHCDFLDRPEVTVHLGLVAQIVARCGGVPMRRMKGENFKKWEKAVFDHPARHRAVRSESPRDGRLRGVPPRSSDCDLGPLGSRWGARGAMSVPR